MTSKVFTLTIVRHGQTFHNKQKIIQGQFESMLTDLGKDQAKLLSNYFERKNIRYDKVYSSDLKRAYETCQIICNGQYEIVRDKLLRERCFGVLEGTPLDNLRAEAYKAGHDESNFTQFRPEGGETIQEFHERIEKFCSEELFPNAENSMSILLVTHGGVIREFFKYFKRLGCPIEHKDMVITPNSGINTFQIKVNSKSECEQVDIISIHKIPHLVDTAKSEALSEDQLNESGMKKEFEDGV